MESRVPGAEYASPLPFTRRQRLSAALLPRAAGALLKLTAWTGRTEIQEARHWNAAMEAPGGLITGFWHETLALALWVYRNTGYHTLTSYSYDGELAARAAAHFCLHAVRGSTSRGGMKALKSLERVLRAGQVIGVTFDGPKGPRREAKPGAAILAARSGLPIVPSALTARPCWRLRSWDRFIIPKPGARILCRYGAPIPPPASVSAAAIQKTQAALNEALAELHAAIDPPDDVDENRAPQ